MFLEKIPVRFRLSVGHALWMAILFAGIGVGVFKFVERNLFQSVDGALLASADSLRKARNTVNYRSPFTQSFLREFFGENFIRPYAQLVDLSGRVSERTENVRVSLPVTPLAAGRAEQGLATIENIPRKELPPLRQITVPVMHQGEFTGELIQVGAPLDAPMHTLRNIKIMLWMALPIGLLLSVIFGYILTAWSLKPVRAVTRAAAKLGSDDLSTRLRLPEANDEIKDLTQTFNSMADRLEDAFLRLRRFAGDVSHELRTPLAVLRGEAEFALRKDRSGKEYQEALSIIERESVNMTSIVEDLLLLARAQSKSVAMNWERTEMREFIEGLAASVQSSAESRKINLKIELDTFETFHASTGFLNLALKNILLNAIKHSSQSSDVELKVSKAYESMIFEIQDHGEGIPKEALPYIFDAFYRADTARNRSAGGAGIGLSLAQALIHLHDGKVEVESEVGKGTRFIVSVPVESKTSRSFIERHAESMKPQLEPPSLSEPITT